ncbi:alpha/beta hydrolase [Skermania sp. ID1734]|uniref:alpha/beta fold hydrolase n=1 Tax=Skermania sp. ID1734 TaxID=2597516 RepID=UPI0011805930|nr:alpha/beta fold hydrolase [Skermania sp. ID1734]TSD96019.1 alpha/beta hydrolase [Skermania sp. ID1734]
MGIIGALDGAAREWAAAVDTAARNAWALSFGEGIERHVPTPSTLLFDEPHRQLRRFGRDGDRRGRPVLLVPPLAAPATCFDLRPGQSLAEFLLDTGRTPYVIDYGTIGYADRNLSFETWIDDILPTAIQRVSDDNGEVDVVAWCLGGTLSLLTAAAHEDLPIRSIATVATPIEYAHLPSLQPLRMTAKLTGGRLVTTFNRLAGGIPSPIVQASFRFTALDREIKKPWFIARNLLETETLARMESIDRFMGAMPGYPGRFYGQLWGRIMLRNDLAEGGLRLGERRIEFARVGVPVLAIAGTGDAITSVPAARHLVEVLTGAPSVRFETEPGSHLGVLTGPHARATTWAHIDRFFAELGEHDAVTVR